MGQFVFAAFFCRSVNNAAAAAQAEQLPRSTNHPPFKLPPPSHLQLAPKDGRKETAEYDSWVYLERWIDVVVLSAFSRAINSKLVAQIYFSGMIICETSLYTIIRWHSFQFL